MIYGIRVQVTTVIARRSSDHTSVADDNIKVLSVVR